MDYSKMLEFHKKNNADATIAVIDVPLEEASRFGIMNANENFEIYEFEEKPKKPKSTLASMGIYIFTWEVLRQYLIKDESNPKSSNDFGKNIIPLMLENDKKMMAYPFEGYWKDVGTIESLWQANMDLLDDKNDLNIHDTSFKIYSVNPMQPPQYVGPNAEVTNSIMAEGCEIYGKVINSVIFPGVYIEENATVRDSVIMSNTKIKKNSIINKAILGQDVIIEEDTLVSNGDEVAVVGEGRVIDKETIDLAATTKI